MPVFYAALHGAIVQVTRRFQGMQEVARRFGFLRPQELLLKSDSKLYTSAGASADRHKDGLSADFPEQVLSFRSAFGSTIKEIELFSVQDLAHTLFIKHHSILPSVPDAATAIKLFLTLPVTVASAERSLSKLKLMKII